MAINITIVLSGLIIGCFIAYKIEKSNYTPIGTSKKDNKDEEKEIVVTKKDIEEFNNKSTDNNSNIVQDVE